MEDKSKQLGSDLNAKAIAKSEKTSARVFASALLFLILGLLVAAGGVVYFYFSNDALFLDRAFYEDKVNNLEAVNSNLTRDITILSEVYDKRLGRDTIADRVLNSTMRAETEVRDSYIDFFNELTSLARLGDNVNLEGRYNSIISKNSRKIDVINLNASKKGKEVSRINDKDKEIGELVSKYRFNRENPVKNTKTANVYDKPELVFSPKLVYGFFSRLGGLVFIELIAFYLLKQYRINMNDFRYYEGINNQLRANAYIVNHIESLQDEKIKVDLLSKLLGSKSDSSLPESDISILPTSPETVNKLLDLVKDLVKK